MDTYIRKKLIPLIYTGKAQCTVSLRNDFSEYGNMEIKFMIKKPGRKEIDAGTLIYRVKNAHLLLCVDASDTSIKYNKITRQKHKFRKKGLQFSLFAFTNRNESLHICDYYYCFIESFDNQCFCKASRRYSFRSLNGCWVG